MARRDPNVTELVEQIGRLKRRIEELESEAIHHCGRAERQRDACAKHLDTEAARIDVEAAMNLGKADVLKTVAELFRAHAAAMRKRTVVS